MENATSESGPATSDPLCAFCKIAYGVAPADYVAATTALRAAELARELGGQWNEITSAGADATQTVFHLHRHLIPRHAGDGLTLPWTT